MASISKTAHGGPEPPRPNGGERTPCGPRCSSSSEFIEEDEFDRGRRRLLNFGHCFGHAIESATGFAVPHGQAVVLGMVLAGLVSCARGWAQARASTSCWRGFLRLRSPLRRGASERGPGARRGRGGHAPRQEAHGGGAGAGHAAGRLAAGPGRRPHGAGGSAGPGGPSRLPRCCRARPEAGPIRS